MFVNVLEPVLCVVHGGGKGVRVSKMWALKAKIFKVKLCGRSEVLCTDTQMDSCVGLVPRFLSRVVFRIVECSEDWSHP